MEQQGREGIRALFYRLRLSDPRAP
ncbi:MAG: hypothetical protein JWR07_3257, partial [Nevskia sp.]|nr:hypothetical protein [Nevskia sp.]